MPPNYHLQSFWETRFQDESHFEWLGDGAKTILPHLRTFLDRWPSSQPKPPRLLHIGAGTSSLSRLIRNVYKEEHADWLEDALIVNTDFSETAVRKGAEATARENWEVWERVDALKWDEVRALVKGKGKYTDEQSGAAADRRFAVVVDKSTSDAISCGEDVSFARERQESHIHPLVEAYLRANCEGDVSIGPLDLLAIHLAGIVRPGGIWIALSYSAWRFPCLQASKDEKEDPFDVGKYWTLERVESVDAPSGQDNPLVYAPPVKHSVYLIRRTAVEIEM